MKALLHVISSFALLVVLQSSAWAQNDAASDKDAEYLDITHEYVQLKDGSLQYNYEHHLRYLTNYAFSRAYGESFIIYNPAWQTLKITTATTRMADGQLVKAPFNAFNEVLPGFAAQAAPYQHLREMVVTHTGLERGSVVHFAYSIMSKKGFLPGLSGKVLVGDRSPIDKMTIRVKSLASSKLNYELRRSDVQPVVSKDGQWTVHTWSFVNIPMLPVESNQPAMDQYLPQLVFAAYDEAAMRSHTGVTDASFALNAKAQAATRAIVESKATGIDKAMALRSHVENNVGLMNGDPSYLGFKAMTAQQCFDRNVGSPLDRAVLLAAMFRSAGIKADPVLTGPGAKHPCLHAWNGVAVLADIDGQDDPILFDPSGSQNSEVPVKFAGVALLSLTGPAPGHYRDTRRQNAVTLTSDWVLGVDGMLKGRSACEFAGTYCASLDPGRHTVPLKRALANAAQGLKISEEKSTVISGTASRVEAAINSARALARVDGLAVFMLPQLPAGIDDLHLNLGPVSRTTPVDLGTTGVYESRMMLHVPKGVTLATKPTLQIENSVGMMRCSIETSDDGIEVIRRLEIRVSTVPPDRYRELRTLLGAWQDATFRTLHLRLAEGK